MRVHLAQRLHRRGNRLMSLQQYARPAGGEVLALQRRRRRADDNRQLHGLVYRFDLVERLDPDDEDRVDAALLVRLCPRHGARRVLELERCGAARDDERRIRARLYGGLELAHHLLDGNQLFLLLAETSRQRGVFYAHRRYARVLQLFHRAHHVERIAVAVVRIDDEAQVGRAHDAAHLVCELGEREHDEIGRGERRVRCDGPGEHADLVTDRFGDARRERIVHASWRQALRAGHQFA
jgi:hypothetical protein